MKNLIATTTLLLILSCNGKEKRNPDKEETIIEQTESGVSSSFKRYQGGNSVLIIYNEMMKSNEQLKQLNTKIEQSSEETEKTISEYEKVLDKSDAYYRDANQLTRSFSDSMLKKNIEVVLKGSSDKYDLKTESLKKIIGELTMNQKIIQDNYMVFKIKKTLPDIEQYQANNDFDLKNLNQNLDTQSQLILELKKLK